MGQEFAGLMDSLGWAILHSLWQGTLAAIAVVIFRNFTKDSQAALRYGFQVLMLALCLVAFMVTFSLYHVAANPAPLVTSEGLAVLTQFTSGAPTPVMDGSATAVSADLGHYAGLYAPLLGLIWCAGFVLLSLKYSAAFVLTQRLRHTGLSPAPSDWQRRFATLVLNSGVRRRVALFISDRVSGPLTLGFFKPVVLVPASFFTGLSSEQAEAILLHEIAHIRRHDYLVNLLQTAIRTIFFFHPAVHYISRRIDNDREHACDDFAVALNHNPDALIKGLAALRLSLTPRPFALAAEGKNTPLMARLKRLGSPEDTRRRPEQVMTSVIALTLAGGLYFAASPLADAKPTTGEQAEPIVEPVVKSVDVSEISHPSAKKQNYRFEQITAQGKTFTAKIAQDGTRWVNVNGSWYDVDKRPEMIAEMPDVPKPPEPPQLKNNPDAPAAKQAWKNDKIMDQYQVNVDYYLASAQNYEELAGGSKSDHKDLEHQMEAAEAAREEALERAERLREDVLERAEQQREEAVERAMENYERALEQAERQRERAEEARDRALEQAEAQMERQMEQAERMQEQAEREAEMAERQAEMAERQYEQLERERERAEALRERDVERAQELREREMERAERRREREMERAERDRERAERKREKHASYGEFSKAMMKQLKKDRLITADADTVTITYPGKKMAVNGKLVSHSVEDNYCKLLDKYGIRKTAQTKIRITPDLFDYVAKEGTSSQSVQETLSQRAEFIPDTDPLKELDILSDIDLGLDVKVTPISFTNPTKASRVTSSFGWVPRKQTTHTGIDLAAPLDTEVLASAPGIVTSARMKGRWGNLVTISHVDGYQTHYAHMNKICVSEGDTVSRGEPIGTVGSTGASTGPHLHFEIKHNGLTQNPEYHITGLGKT